MHICYISQSTKRLVSETKSLFLTATFHTAVGHHNPREKQSKRYLRGAFNKFLDLFVQALKLVVDSCKLSMFLLYIL